MKKQNKIRQVSLQKFHYFLQWKNCVMLLQLDMLWLVDNTKWWIIYQPAAAIGGGGVRAR